MITTSKVREQTRLKEIAKEYESKGYNVVIEPTSSQLPKFLRNYQPDLIAIGPSESVVVEVKSRDSLEVPSDMQSIAKIIENQPGWRFEFVLTNPKQRETSNKNLSLLSASDLEIRLHEARKISKQIHGSDIALLLLWVVLEGCLSHLAQQKDLNIEKVTPRKLVKELYSLGAISRDELSILEKLIEQRNRVVHAYAIERSNSSLFQSGYRFAEKLLRSLKQV